MGLGLLVCLFFASFLCHLAFAVNKTDIPVEVIWPEQNPSSRPASVTLRLLDNDSEVQNITLTSVNEDPNDGNKWVGTFTNVAYSDSYTVAQDAIAGYDSTVETAPVLTNASVTNIQQEITLWIFNASYSIYDSNVTWLQRNDKYYIWTLDEYTGEDFDALIDTIERSANTTITTDSIGGYQHGLPSEFSIDNNGTISYSESNEGITVSLSVGFSMWIINYGTLSKASGNTVVLNNTLQERTLTVHHIYEDGSLFHEDEVSTLLYGSEFTTSPIESEDYTGTVQDGVTSGVITEDTEITYIYRTKTYKVIYVFSGDVLPPNADDILPATVDYPQGVEVTLQIPTAYGYIFSGWDRDTNFIMPAEDVMVYGSWILHEEEPIPTGVEQNIQGYSSLIALSIVGGGLYIAINHNKLIKRYLKKER